MVEGELAEEGAQLLGRPRLQYTYSRKSGLKEDKKLSSGLDCSDNEQDDFQEVRSHSINLKLHPVKVLLKKKRERDKT